MKNLLQRGLMLVLLITAATACTRIDSSGVGIKVKNYGTERGVQSVTEVTGWVWYWPLSTSVYEFPINVRHKEYTGESALKVQSKDGSEFLLQPYLNYRIYSEKATQIFVKYRKDLEDIEEGFLKTAIFEAFKIAANKYTADNLISHRQEFDSLVIKALEKQLEPEGFHIEQFTYNMEYPKALQDAINAKNNAVQRALAEQNKVIEAQATAQIKIAKAVGDSTSMIKMARAEAEANKIKQLTITPMLLQQMWIEKWNGTLPQYQMGQGQGMNFMLPLK